MEKCIFCGRPMSEFRDTHEGFKAEIDGGPVVEVNTGCCDPCLKRHGPVVKLRTSFGLKSDIDMLKRQLDHLV